MILYLLYSYTGGVSPNVSHAESNWAVDSSSQIRDKCMRTDCNYPVRRLMWVFLTKGACLAVYV